MSSNLRDREGHANSFWDWGIVNGCFGKSIRVSDIDGIVERKGKFLVIETKRDGEEMPNGQRWMLDAFVKQGHNVVVVTGDPLKKTMSSVVLWFLGKDKNIRRVERGKCVKDFVELCRRWYLYVNS